MLLYLTKTRKYFFVFQFNKCNGISYTKKNGFSFIYTAIHCRHSNRQVIEKLAMHFQNKVPRNYTLTVSPTLPMLRKACHWRNLSCLLYTQEKPHIMFLNKYYSIDCVSLYIQGLVTALGKCYLFCASVQSKLLLTSVSTVIFLFLFPPCITENSSALIRKGLKSHIQPSLHRS